MSGAELAIHSVKSFSFKKISNFCKNNYKFYPPALALPWSVSVVKVSGDTVLLGAVSDSLHYDFVMCNPPFYSDKKER